MADNAGGLTGRALFYARKLLLRRPVRCGACGHLAGRAESSVLSKELVADWNLSPRQAREMDIREGRKCLACYSTMRSVQLASVLRTEIKRRTGRSNRSLAEAMRHCHDAGLKVAEINSAGSLHPFLSQLPTLAYSEYGSTHPAIPSEDLSALSYGVGQFDFVVTSDTLEHVPHVRDALREIARVLKPGGAHVFTVPIVWGRPTRRRAELIGDAVENLMSPSFHGHYASQRPDMIVFHEFGDDFVGWLADAGFVTELVTDPKNPALTVFVARLTETQRA